MEGVFVSVDDADAFGRPEAAAVEKIGRQLIEVVLGRMTDDTQAHESLVWFATGRRVLSTSENTHFLEQVI